LIVSQAKTVALLEDLRARWPATQAELVARLAWPEALVRGALDVLAHAGELDYETKDVGGRIVRVWWAEPEAC
jgi:hypothetical protein